MSDTMVSAVYVAVTISIGDYMDPITGGSIGDDSNLPGTDSGILVMYAGRLLDGV